MSTTRLQQQVERILDENAANTVSVIVQAVPEELTAGARAAVRRQLLTRALTRPRGLLPSRARPEASPTEPDRGTWVAALQVRGTDAIRPLAESSLISGSLLARRSDAAGRPRAIPLASAAAFEISRDDLATLAGELPSQYAIHPNRHVPVPAMRRSTEVPLQVASKTTHSWGLETAGALSCWGAFGARGQGVNVAVLDTGVNALHPDLAGKVKKFAEFDAKGNMVASDVAQARDDDGHGTHVCGTIAGGRASGRHIGFAPAANLHVGKVLGKSGGTDEQILAGIAWAVASGADIINMSLGGLSWEPDVIDTYSTALFNARRSGALVVAAIGNDGHQLTGSPGNDLFALAVGATDVLDCVAGFSGGRTQVVQQSAYLRSADLPFVYSKPDLCAAGVDVYSCSGKKWAYLSGTSMAAPHVAGAAALLLSKTNELKSHFGGLSGEERSTVIEQLLIGSVHELGENGQDHRYGWGRLNALSALAAAIETGYLELV